MLKHGCVFSSNFLGKNSEKEFILNQWTGLQNIAEAVYNICLVFCSLFGPYNPCIWLEIVEADTHLVIHDRK